MCVFFLCQYGVVQSIAWCLMYHIGVGVVLHTGKTRDKRPEPSDNRVALQCPETGAGRCWEEGSRSGQVTL